LLTLFVSPSRGSQADAKKFMQQKNKRSALQCLKRKKVYETQVDKLGATRFAIEQQVMTLEQANVSVEAMQAMKMGAQSMKTIQKDMTIDDVDKTMDDIQEQMDIANEISDAISQPLGGDVMDDDDLLAELEDLEQADLDEQLLGVEPAGISTPSMPETPQTTPAVPAAAVQTEEDEFAALEASMAT
jgi:charged multivesicular body protein 4A/B